MKTSISIRLRINEDAQLEVHIEVGSHVDHTAVFTRKETMELAMGILSRRGVRSAEWNEEKQVWAWKGSS